jgi:hypothetical protein
MSLVDFATLAILDWPASAGVTDKAIAELIVTGAARREFPLLAADGFGDSESAIRLASADVEFTCPYSLTADSQNAQLAVNIPSWWRPRKFLFFRFSRNSQIPLWEPPCGLIHGNEDFR